MTIQQSASIMQNLICTLLEPSGDEQRNMRVLMGMFKFSLKLTAQTDFQLLVAQTQNTFLQKLLILKGLAPRAA